MNRAAKTTIASGAILLLFLGYGLGYWAAASRNLPHHWTEMALQGGRSLVETLLSDGVPHAFLQPARSDGAGVVRGRGLADGKLILLSSFFEGHSELRLIRRDGSVVVRWPLEYSRLFAGQTGLSSLPEDDWHVDVHGIVAHPDGDVAFNFDYFGSVRLSRCGGMRWRLEHPTHHSIELAAGGGYWILGREPLEPGDERLWPFLPPAAVDLILRVSDAGKIVDRLSIPQLMVDSGLGYLLTANGDTIDDAYRQRYALVHANKVGELPAALADAFPLFSAGDLVVSMRNLNLLLVLDPKTRKVKWHQTGPYVRQHDPEFNADGTLTLFDNGMYRRRSDAHGRPLPSSRGHSRLLRIDPASGRASVIYGEAEGQRFRSSIRGKHEALAGGGFLITDFEGGRALEIDRDGREVWEYVNRFDEQHVAEITEARAYDADYFEVEDWSCDGVATRGE